MSNNVWIYIAVAAAVTYLIRVLPLTVFKKPIKNRFVRSFLYYVPYATLAAMTFPAIINATASPISGIAALAAGVAAARLSGNLFIVAAASGAAVFIIELFL